jgi:uncharacterized protein (UPF0212 family)
LSLTQILAKKTVFIQALDKLVSIFINLKFMARKTNKHNKRLEKGVYLGKTQKKNFVGGGWFGSGF